MPVLAMSVVDSNIMRVLSAGLLLVILGSCETSRGAESRASWLPVPHPNERLAPGTVRFLYGDPARVVRLTDSIQWWYSAVQMVRSGWEDGPMVVDWCIEFSPSTGVGVPMKLDPSFAIEVERPE